jgi:hypothetical protein
MPINIYNEIRAERANQNERWGGPPHDDAHTSGDWAEYIVRHLAKAFTDNTLMQDEAASRFARYLHPAVRKHDDRAVKRRQLIRVAALAVAAVESMDRLAVNHGDET